MQTQENQPSTGTNISGNTPNNPGSLLSQPLKISEVSGIRSQDSRINDKQKEQEIKLRFSEETHQYVREYIRLADQKATFFFAGATALLAYLHKLGFANRWAINPNTWMLVDMLSFVSTVSLTLSTIACLLAIIPRLDGSKRSTIFFGAIREFESAQSYASEVIRLSPSELCEEKLKHIYELTDICKKKYAVLKWGQWFGACGILATILLFILH